MTAMASRRRGPLGPALWTVLAQAAWPLFVLAMVAGAAWGGQKLWRTWTDPTYWPVGEVIINGAGDYVDETSIQLVLEAEMAKGFLGMDLYAAQESLMTNAWIAQAVLAREWPNRLRVDIVEQVPLALWQGDRVMNIQGEIFRPVLDSIPDGLPVLAGAEGRQWAVWERYQTLVDVLNDSGLQLAGVREDERGSLDLFLADGGRIRVGGAEVEARIQRFLDVYPKTIQKVMESVAEIDLRYPNGFSVKWRDGSRPTEMENNATLSRGGT